MIDRILLWLHSNTAGEFLLTVLVSMLPVLELRGGMPFGVALGLPMPAAFLAALIGNMLPVPFIILFTRDVFKWLRRRIPRLGGWLDRLEARAYAKSEKVQRYQFWGLLILVAIPLPGTGVWTGALVAALMDLRLKSAVPAIFFGVLIAGCIVLLLTSGVLSIFS